MILSNKKTTLYRYVHDLTFFVDTIIVAMHNSYHLVAVMQQFVLSQAPNKTQKEAETDAILVT